MYNISMSEIALVNLINMSDEKDFLPLFNRIYAMLVASNRNYRLLSFSFTCGGALEALKIINDEAKLKANDVFSQLVKDLDAVDINQQAKVFQQMEHDRYLLNRLSENINLCQSRSRRRVLKKLHAKISGHEYPLVSWLACIRQRYELLNRYGFKEEIFTAIA